MKLATVAAFGVLLLTQGGLERFSASVVSRQVQGGKSVTLRSELFFQANGNLVTHYIFPKEYVLLSNRLGEAKLYDPAANTVYKTQNSLYSTQATQISYFFTGRIADMGLTKAGYVPDKTYPENAFLVTLWKLRTPDRKALIQAVKTVYDHRDPIFMDYRGVNGKILRKVFFYNYVQLADFRFPSTTTEILYSGTDSTVTKTVYSDFRINGDANSAYFDYQVPAGARIQQ